LAKFADAEGRLYPMAIVDAACYERATGLVGLVVTELRRSCADIGSVLTQRSELIASLPALAAGAGLAAAGLPPDVVVDAASAVRCRELQAVATARATQGRIDEARSAGQEWLIDEPDPAEVMAGSYRRVERHLPTNSTLIMAIEAGRDGASSEYSIELIAVATAGATTSRTWRYPDREAWVVAAEHFRAEVHRG
jgi:hypothetical protein